jgi:hypothetical protein
MRPAALSNPSPEDESPIKPLPPTRFRNPGRQHSFVQQNQPHRIDQPVNLNSSGYVMRRGPRVLVDCSIPDEIPGFLPGTASGELSFSATKGTAAKTLVP